MRRLAQTQRLLRACLVLAVAFCAVMSMDPALEALGFDVSGLSASAGVGDIGGKVAKEAEALDEQERSSVLDSVIDAADDGGAASLEEAGLSRFVAEDVPAPVREEVLFAFGCDVVVAVPGFSVFGVPGFDAAADDSWKSSLVEAGWLEVESGSALVSTFAKDEGGCRWLMVQPTGSGEEAMTVATLSWKLVS